MAHVIRSFQRLVTYLVATLILTIIILILFHQFVAGPISLSKLIEQAVQIIIVLTAFSLSAVIIRRFKPLLSQRVGIQITIIMQAVLLTVAVIVATFGVFSILKFSVTTLLASAGILSITAGLIISTFVGSLLSGFMVFTTYQFEEGDSVIVNNVPGKVTEMTALVMRIQTDVGQITVPNSAIATGAVIITSQRKYEPLKEGRLHYNVGDRVITSFMNEQGKVKEVTPLHTIIDLDSGKEITFLNSSILSGAVVMARITQAQKETEKKSASSASEGVH